jgi:dihydrofolate reductase
LPGEANTPLPQITLIAALDSNGLIGKENRIPWHVPEDLAWFRGKTLGHTVIMGRKTWMSLGRTLDQRVNIVLTRDQEFCVPGAIVCHSVQEVLEHCGDDECFVIGGGQVFELFLPLADKLLITRIDAVFEGDTWFPAIDPALWKLVFYETAESVSGFALSYLEYRRMEGFGKNYD